MQCNKSLNDEINLLKDLIIFQETRIDFSQLSIADAGRKYHTMSAKLLAEQ